MVPLQLLETMATICGAPLQMLPAVLWARPGRGATVGEGACSSSGVLEEAAEAESMDTTSDNEENSPRSNQG